MVAGCRAQEGSVCYYCEYSHPKGGYSVCGENEAGDIQYCIDFDDIPF